MKTQTRFLNSYRFTLHKVAAQTPLEVQPWTAATGIHSARISRALNPSVKNDLWQLRVVEKGPSPLSRDEIGERGHQHQHHRRPPSTTPPLPDWLLELLARDAAWDEDKTTTSSQSVGDVCTLAVEPRPQQRVTLEAFRAKATLSFCSQLLLISTVNESCKVGGRNSWQASC